MESEKAKQAANQHLHHQSTPSATHSTKSNLASLAHPYHHASPLRKPSKPGSGANGNGSASYVPRIAEALVDSEPFLYRIDSKPRWALMCLPTKAGSTMWKRALTRGLLEQGLPMVDEPGKWNGQDLPYSVNARDILLYKVPRIMFVRHPLARLLSAYLGKATTGVLNVTGWKRSSGFSGFVKAITSTTDPAKLDAHFRLQVDQCGIQELRDANMTRSLGYRYLHVEKMGHWYREAVCALGIAKAVSVPSIYWRDFAHDRLISPAERVSAAYNRTTQCFVRTRDCGCDLHCKGHHCNASRAGTAPHASYASFNEAGAKLKEYYTADLASRVNEWAAEDLREFGYRPWMPDQSVEAMQPQGASDDISLPEAIAMTQ